MWITTDSAYWWPTGRAPGGSFSRARRLDRLNARIPRTVPSLGVKWAQPASDDLPKYLVMQNGQGLLTALAHDGGSGITDWGPGLMPLGNRAN